MAGQHHQCNGHELGQTLGDGEARETWCASIHEVAKSWSGQVNNRAEEVEAAVGCQFKKRDNEHRARNKADETGI